MNELSTTIGIRTAMPPPIRLAAARARRRRGEMAPAALVRSRTAIGSAAHRDAFPALLHQVGRYAADSGAVGEDARVGVEPDVGGLFLHGRRHGVLQGGRVVGRAER